MNTADPRVLLVTDRWDAEGGGRERYVSELVRAFRQRGRTVDVLTEEARGRRARDRAVRQHQLRHPPGLVLSVKPITGATHYQLHSGVHAAAFAAERDACDSLIRRALFYPALSLNRRRQRVLRTEMQLCAVGTPTRLMVFSERCRAELRRRFGCAGQQVTVARPGVNLQRFHPDSRDRAEPGGRMQLLFVGHNFVLKGLRWVLEALAQIRRHGVDAHLVVAGRGPTRAFAGIACRLRVEAFVRFAGDLAQHELADVYRQSHLLVHPAFFDPFPRSVVEAMACGVPVVTTRACGGSEIIASGENGFVVSDPRAVDELVEAIGATAAPGRHHALSAAASVTGRSFDFEAHVDDVVGWLGPDT